MVGFIAWYFHCQQPNTFFVMPAGHVDQFVVDNHFLPRFGYGQFDIRNFDLTAKLFFAAAKSAEPWKFRFNLYVHGVNRWLQRWVGKSWNIMEQMLN